MLWIFLNPVAYIVYALFGMYFLFVWLPHRLHILRIGYKYGWPKEKRDGIIELFRTGAITSVGYIGMKTDQTFMQITGPWGEYQKTEVDGDFITLPGSDELPEEVRKVFKGYIFQARDISYLIWNPSFVMELQKQVPDICCGDIWNPSSFAIYKKGCAFILEVEPGSLLEDTVLRVTQ